jgi:hypothetical protein
LYAKIRNDKKTRPTIKSIAMTDFHIDPDYKEGAPTKCPFTICCKEFEGYTIKAGDPGATKYGSPS